MAAHGFRRMSFSVSAIIFAILVISGFLTISNIVGEQSKQQQQSVSPVFSLFENEILTPMHIAKTLADAGIFEQYFIQDEPDEAALMAQLSALEEKFGYTFYLAHDASRKQFNSDGRVFDLIEGDVIWYFALKNEFDSDVQAVLGNREDVHLYIDVRQYDTEGQFSGFVGLGKSLSEFIDSFADFRKRYGHEFIFVNNRHQIVLSSLDDLAPQEAIEEDGVIGIKNISDVEWFESFSEQAAGSEEPSEVVSSGTGDLLVSQLTLQNLNWQLYLVTPLNIRQAEVNKSFALYVAGGLVAFFIIYNILQRLIEGYMNKISRKINKDRLSELPNREHASLFFSIKRKKQRQMSIVLADIDGLGDINSTYGNLAGDKVVQEISKILQTTLTGDNIVVRWEGEEFVMIMPDVELSSASDMAEECRTSIENHQFQLGEHNVKLTASFGVFASRQYEDTLDVMVKRAAKALDMAKAAGKNQIAQAA